MSDGKKISIREFQRGFGKARFDVCDVYAGKGGGVFVGQWKPAENLTGGKKCLEVALSDGDKPQGDACRTEVPKEGKKIVGRKNIVVGQGIVGQKDKIKAWSEKNGGRECRMCKARSLDGVDVRECEWGVKKFWLCTVCYNSDKVPGETIMYDPIYFN